MEHMPSFDEWGLCPDSLVGPRENPVNVVPLFVAGAELAPSVDAGRQAPSEADGPSTGVLMPLGAPEASSSGARDSCPGAVAAGATQRATPETSAGRCEMAPDSTPRLGTPEAIPSSASPAAPRTGRHVQRFGRLCVGFEELHKRKGYPSGSSGIYGPLKRRKYIVVDE